MLFSLIMKDVMLVPPICVEHMISDHDLIDIGFQGGPFAW